MKTRSGVTVACALALLALSSTTRAVVTSPGKQIENLDRGTVAMMNASGQPFVS